MDDDELLDTLDKLTHDLGTNDNGTRFEYVESLIDDRGIEQPETDFGRQLTPSTDMEAITVVNRFIRKEYGLTHANMKTDAAIDLRNRITIRPKGNILFRERGSTQKLLKPRVVLTSNPSGHTYHRSTTNRSAVEQFTESIDMVIAEFRAVDETSATMPVIDTTPPRTTSLPGLTPQGNRELMGSLTPNIDVLEDTRDESLRIQADHFYTLMQEAAAEMDREEDPERFIDISERVASLRQARDLVLEQRGLEGIRDAQEEDITRLENIKRWFRENLVGLSALGMSLAGIITTLVVAGRTALAKGA
jgi:hypothetical protein